MLVAGYVNIVERVDIAVGKFWNRVQLEDRYIYTAFVSEAAVQDRTKIETIKQTLLSWGDLDSLCEY